MNKAASLYKAVTLLRHTTALLDDPYYNLLSSEKPKTKNQAKPNDDIATKHCGNPTLSSLMEPLPAGPLPYLLREVGRDGVDQLQTETKKQQNYLMNKTKATAAIIP